MRKNTVRQRLREGQPAIGTWLSLCSPMAARFLARTGFHWLTVDIEHSPVGWESTAAMFAATADAGCVPLARVPAGKHDYIKRVLDNGGYGFVVPMVMSREETTACVAAAKYPPVGNRSLGGALHALNFNASATDYYSRANDEILVVPQCEHIRSVERAEEIYGVDGVDAVFIGPNDLRASMRDASGIDPSPAAFEDAVQAVLRACNKLGIAAGIHCFSANDVAKRLEQGWRFLALGSDLSMMLAAAKNDLASLGIQPAGQLANY